MNNVSDIRELSPKDKLLFIYSCGIEKAHHNAHWAKRMWITDVDIFVAQPINYLSTVPFVIVSKGNFNKLTDPHIKEHQWVKISFDELDQLLEVGKKIMYGTHINVECDEKECEDYEYRNTKTSNSQPTKKYQRQSTYSTDDDYDYEDDFIWYNFGDW